MILLRPSFHAYMKILLHLVLILVPISITSSRPFGRARVAFHHSCSFISNHQIKKITSASNNERWTKAQSTTATTRHDSPLYGIKGFRGWFEATFPSSLVTVDAPKITREYYTTGQKRRKEAPKVVDLNNKTSLPQIYDHVLIDANQYLHSTLRRAYNRNVKKRLRNETIDWEYGLDEDTLELSLVFFVRELEQLVTSIAIPRKSIVIALDGSPGAAKIDMQRQRRFGIYRKAETQRKLISFLIERGWTDSDFGISTSTNIKGIENIIFSKHDREQISLSISPGTEYMDRVTSAILYWSWMSLSKRHWPTESLDDKQPQQVKIYVSPSSVPGEGEVKLIDWIMHGNNSTSKHNKKPLVQMGDSVAFVGGDSDLVLMGMVIPPTVTHNINILLPRELKQTSFYVASIWNTTKMLAKYLTGELIYGNSGGHRQPKRQASNDAITLVTMSHAKLDTVLLIIMNGNDYLPKVRGVQGGFDSFFTTYFQLVKDQLEKNDAGSDSMFMIHINSDNMLSINVPFALAFFREMLRFEPHEMARLVEQGDVSVPQYQLGVLYNLCEARILPHPLCIETTDKGDSHFERELLQLNSKSKRKSIKAIYGQDIEIVRMTLGNYPFDARESSKWNTTILGRSDGHGVVSRMISEENSNGRSYLFEVPHRRNSSLTKTKRRLACLALEEIFGAENMELFGYDDSNESDDDDINDEKAERVSADVKCYLAGLLWTLETYQSGHCVDWGYNYGQRAAPAVFEIVEFLQDLSKDGITNLYRTDLIKDTALPPLSDGLTCLAALPPQAYSSLVREPYDSLVQSPEKFEQLYKSCIDPATAVFDMALFQKKCAALLMKRKDNKKTDASNPPTSDENSNDQRNIYTGSKHWTVIARSRVPLQHPFKPPQPYTSRAFPLRQNKRIKVSKLAASTGKNE